MTTPLSLHIGDLPPMARVRALPHPTRGRKWSSRERTPVSKPAMPLRAAPIPGSSRRKLDMSRRERSIEFQLIFAAAFVVFLFTAALSRLSPARLLAHQDSSVAAKPILAEAREAASISAVYAFMG